MNNIENIFYNGDLLLNDLKKFKVIELNRIDKKIPEIKFDIGQQPAFNKKFKLLIENISSFKKDYIKIYCVKNTNKDFKIFSIAHQY